MVTNNALRMLETARRKEKPFFLFVHYFDPHFLYNHHPAFDRTTGYDGDLTPGMPIAELREKSASMDAEDIDYLVGLYREEIAFTDHHIGRLLAGLKRMKLRKRTLVILTADHGEAFMEHGWIGHTIHLFDELLHVPLIVSLPGVIAPHRVDTPVSLLDVAPTVAEFTLPRGASAVIDHEGRSLAPLLFGKEGFDGRRPLFAEVSFEEPEKENPGAPRKRAFLTAVRAGPYKLIHELEGDVFTLYDLNADPLETEGKDVTKPVVRRTLKPLLEQWENLRAAGVASTGGSVISEDDLKRARALGYVK